MRNAILLLAAALLISTSVPALAEVTESQKNECLLASKNCTEQVDDIFMRMKRLDKEIKKGTKVYSAAELKRLEQKLTETQKLLRSMEKPGR